MTGGFLLTFFYFRFNILLGFCSFLQGDMGDSAMSTVTSRLIFSKNDVEGENATVIRVTFHGWRIGEVTPKIITDLRSAMSASCDAVKALAERSDQEYQSILFALSDAIEGLKLEEIGTVEECSLWIYFDVRYTRFV